MAEKSLKISLTNSLLITLFPPSLDSTMADKSKKLQQVQVFGRKRNAVAVVSTSPFSSKLYTSLFAVV